MNSFRSEYKTADNAVTSIVRIIVLIATVTSAYAVYHFNISDFQHERARRQVLFNSLFLLERLNDEKSARKAGARELVDHLLGELAPHHSRPGAKAMLEQFYTEAEAALGSGDVILTESPLFASTNSCPIALWRVPGDLSPAGGPNASIKYAVVSGGACAFAPHALLPAALEFSADGRPIGILLTPPLHDLFPTFSIFSDCRVRDDCAEIPALLSNHSKLASGYPFIRGLGDSRTTLAISIEVAGLYAQVYWPYGLTFKPPIDVKSELEEELRKQAPVGPQRFLGFEFKESLVVHFVAMAALSGLAVLLIASIRNLRRSSKLILSSPSLLVDPVGLLPKLVRLSMIVAPATSALLIALLVQDHLRKPFVIPILSDAIYVNPLRGHFFRVSDPLLHDTRLFEVAAGSWDVVYAALLLTACATIGVSMIASFALSSLSGPIASVVKKKLGFRARRASILKVLNRSKLPWRKPSSRR